MQGSTGPARGAPTGSAVPSWLHDNLPAEACHICQLLAHPLAGSRCCGKPGTNHYTSAIGVADQVAIQ